MHCGQFSETALARKQAFRLRPWRTSSSAYHDLVGLACGPKVIARLCGFSPGAGSDLNGHAAQRITSNAGTFSFWLSLNRTSATLLGGIGVSKTMPCS